MPEYDANININTNIINDNIQSAYNLISSPYTSATNPYANLSRQELIDIIHDLSLECDMRAAHEEALEQQIYHLGGIPTQYSVLDPSPLNWMEVVD
jgi:hypothetical protein